MKIHIKHGRLIDATQSLDRVADIYIAAGKIVGIDKAPDGFQANQVIDATGCVVSPGLVDISARLRE
ncbi:MAG: dihydroorotase, partial [Methylophilaceae bacterium]